MVLHKSVFSHIEHNVFVHLSLWFSFVKWSDISINMANIIMSKDKKNAIQINND